MKMIKKVSIEYNYDIFLFAGFVIAIFDYFQPTKGSNFLIAASVLCALILYAIGYKKTTVEEIKEN